jgi:hypothetical protein
VILSKFWSRYDFQNFRKRTFLGDDQGELSKPCEYHGYLQLYTYVYSVQLFHKYQWYEY